MTGKRFTYSFDPKSSVKDKVRFLLGDTDANDALLADAEILCLIEDEGSPLRAAAAGALAIAAQFCRSMDESVGDVSKSYSQRAEHYKSLATALKKRAAEQPLCPIAGGISISAKEQADCDPDLTKSAFTRDLHNNPRAPSSSQAPDDNDDYNT